MQAACGIASCVGYDGDMLRSRSRHAVFKICCPGCGQGFFLSSVPSRVGKTLVRSDPFEEAARCVTMGGRSAMRGLFAVFWKRADALRDRGEAPDRDAWLPPLPACRHPASAATFRRLLFGSICLLLIAAVLVIPPFAAPLSRPQSFPFLPSVRAQSLPPGAGDSSVPWLTPELAALTARGWLERTWLGVAEDVPLSPQQTMTRAAFVVLLVNAFGEPLPAPLVLQTEPLFADVNDDDPLRRYLEAAWEYGWFGSVDPRPGDPFAPHDPLDRATAVSWLARAADLADAASGRLPYPDEALIPEEARAAVAAAEQAGVLPFAHALPFAADAFVTLEEAVLMTANTLAMQARLYDAIGDVIAVDAASRQLRVRLLEGEQVLRVADGALVFRNRQPAELTSLQPLDHVAFVVDARGRVVLLDATFADALGSLVEIRPLQHLVRYRDQRGVIQTRTLGGDAVFFRHGEPVHAADLRQGDRLYLVFDGAGRVRMIDAMAADLEGHLWSRMTSARDGFRLRVGRTYAAAAWYPLAGEAVVILDGQRADVLQLRLGDHIVAALSPAHEVVYIEARRETP